MEKYEELLVPDFSAEITQETTSEELCDSSFCENEQSVDCGNCLFSTNLNGCVDLFELWKKKKLEQKNDE